MSNLFALIRRHRLNFLRDRVAVFFSLLSVFITISLYILFLKKMQVDFLADVASDSKQLTLLVDKWFVAGILSIIPVTTTLAQFHIPIHDTERRVTADFLTTPVPRAILQLSYMCNAIITGFIFSLIAFFLCELLIVVNGGTLLTFAETVRVLLILLLAVILSSTMNALLTMFLKTQNAFSIISTLVGTFIGFLCGVYIPLGMLPTFVQYIIMYFPISHLTLLLRDVFMSDSLADIFANAPPEVLEEYTLMFGVVFKMHGQFISPVVSYLFSIGSIGILLFFLIFLYTRKFR